MRSFASLLGVSQVVALSLLVGSVSTPAWATEWRPNHRFEVSWITASRGGYIFAGSDATKIGNLGLATGKTFGDSGKHYAIRPYGIEAEGRFRLSERSHVRPTIRLVPMGLQLSPGSAAQSGWDGFVTVAYAFLPEIADGRHLGFDFGLRLRRWQLESGAFPSTAHGGFILAARYETRTVSAVFEAGLMAMGIGTPASLGVQRDSSTLRARVSYRIETSPVDITPWLEFFHTHRDFYGGTLRSGENSLFVDEASLALGLGVTL